MYGDEFKCIFSAFEWDNILRMFQNEVKAKRYQKMHYESWRELKELSASMETWDQVRVYWNDWGYDRYSLITVYIDCKANDRLNEPFEFDMGDHSFGDFLYELELYREEKDQMRVKESYYTDTEGREWQTYDRYPVKGYSLDADVSELLKSSGSLGVSVLDDRVDVAYDTLATKADVSSLSRVEEKVNTLAAEMAAATPMKNCVSDTNKNIMNDKKENSVMKFNFDFGPVNGSMVRMSLYGLAVKNKAGTWVSYDAKAGDIMDVDILNFDGAKFLYKMPVATKDIAIGDVVIHNGIPMFVIAIAVNGTYITAVDPINGERKDIMLPKSPFGFNFATKVVNLLGNLNGGATSDNPFGNLGLMLMMGDGNKDMEDLLPLMLATGNGGALGNLDMSNPLMMYLILGNGTMDKFLPLMFLANNTNTAAPAHTCTCGGHCGENHTQA